MENFRNLIEANKNENGGGLATNITGRFESNRHAIARMEKVTFGEAVAFLKKKKNGGLKISVSVVKYTEMNGKYGWFESNSRYNLPEYYSGWAFRSKKMMEKYLSF